MKKIIICVVAILVLVGGLLAFHIPEPLASLRRSLRVRKSHQLEKPFTK